MDSADRRASPRALPAFAGVGIEIEYMIVDAATLDVRPLAGEFLAALAGRRTADVAIGPIGWSNELVKHVVELKNLAPDRDLARLDGLFAGAVRKADAALASHGARLMPGGMHPWMAPAHETALWDDGDDTVYRSYDRLFGCAQHGFANLQSMHVNLPFAGDDEFARLHAAVRCVLPLIPALAASSPIAEGRIQGSLDHRLEAYRVNQARVASITGAVVPERASSRREYEQCILAPMYRDIAELDPAGTLQHEWLNSRGAIARFDRSALEIRLADTQECPAADLAVAQAIVLVTRALYEERFAPSAALDLPTERLAALLRSSMRDGDRTVVDDAAYLALFGLPARPTRFGELWSHCIAATADATHAWCHDAWRAILDHGPLARRILTALDGDTSRPSLHAVYRSLCECLAHDRPFVPR